MGKLTTKKEILPFLPIVIGLGELEAAAAIGISASKFRQLVSQKRMPSPRRLDGRKIWDVDELRDAYKELLTTKRLIHGGRGLIRLKYVKRAKEL
jgi:predicted DNA-binding transcriptional regulator AlpA